MSRSLVSTFAAAALALIAAEAPARAEPPSAEPQAGLKLNLGYNGRLLFVKVLDIRLQEQVSRTEHASSARIASYGVLDAFRHIDIDAQESGRIVHGDPAPGVFRHHNHDGKRNRQVEVAWQPSDVVTTASPAIINLGDPPATREQRLSSVGYLTAALRLTVAADNGPCTGSQRIFNGKELSEIGFSDPHPVALNGAQKALGLTSAVRCDAAFREIAGYKKKPGRKPALDRPLQVDFAQVGLDGPWVVARLQTRTVLGAAVIQLGSVKVEGHLPQASSKPPADSSPMVNSRIGPLYVVGNKY